MAEKNDLIREFSDMLEAEINETFAKAAFYSSILGIGGGVFLLGIIQVKLVQNLEIPMLWAFASGIYSFFVYLIARSKLLHGFMKYVIIILYVSIPSILYIISIFALPSKTATYLMGPPSYLYVFLVMISGFLFDRGISTAAGIASGFQYFLFFLIAQPYLNQLSHPDPRVLQELTTAPFFILKALVMVFTGIVVGILSSNAKKLVFKLLNKEKQNAQLDRVFGQFVSKEVKDKIIRENKEAIAEKRNLAVLFSDIRSFSTFSESRAPEEIVRQLNEYFDRMVYSITSNGGIIDKFIGDAVMATFGGVIELENPHLSAFNAAQSMRQELSKLNATWVEKGWSALNNGIGLHFGEVLQGTIGSAERKDFTVIGDNVNTASRLESLTKEKGYALICSDAFLNGLPDDKKTGAADLGEVLVKGKKVPVRIYGFKLD